MSDELFGPLAVTERLTVRVRTLSRWLTAAISTIVLMAVALLGQYAILTQVNGGVDAIQALNNTNECRTRKVIQIDQIKDDPRRTPLALEIFQPTTTPERRAEIAALFAAQSAEIDRLQDERLACAEKH